MPAFKDIVGHEQIIEHLQNALGGVRVLIGVELREPGVPDKALRPRL